MDLKYPLLNNECAEAISKVRSGRIPGRVSRQGCVNIVSGWKHWPCLFPQQQSSKSDFHAMWREVRSRREL